MDLEAHDLVIGKLESTLKSLKPEDRSINSSALKIQLANLYSEKARILLVEEGKQGCENCLNSTELRKKAIKLYSSLSAEQLDQDGGQSSLQLAYLLEITNNKQALSIYNRLIKKTNLNKEILVKAYTKRAEYYFKEGLFDLSIKDFQKVQTLSSASEYDSVLHKIAWAYFNKGEIEKSIDLLFQILTKYNNQVGQTHPQNNDSNQKDESFPIEVARDLSLFITKTQVTLPLLNRVFSLTPKSERANNLIYFSEESERVGEINNAILAWNLLATAKELPGESKSRAYMGLARYHREGHRYTQANQFYVKALEAINENTSNKTRSSGPSAEVKNLKTFLTQWEKQIAKFTQLKLIKESKLELVKAYQSYLKFYSSDFEVQLWLAQQAQQLNKNDVALAAYSNASEIIAKNLATLTSSNSDGNGASKNESKVSSKNNENSSKDLKKLLNEVLLTEVSLCEASSNIQLKLTAYDHYLNLNPTGPEYAKVRYQKAKLYYDQNDTSKSYELFNAIAEDPSYNDSEFKVKAAHLALDALVLKKNISLLEEKSLEYSKLFPQQAREFNQIAFKAGLQITQSLAAQDNSLKNTEVALSKLNAVGMNPSSQNGENHKKYLSAKIELEIKAHHWNEALASINTFLSNQSLKRSERFWALNKKLSIAELILDFKSAHQTLVQLNYMQSKDPKDLLKGALIAELAQLNAQPWLEKVVRSPKSSREQVALARVQMIRLSASPWHSIHKMTKNIQSHPALFSGVILEVYSKDSNPDELKWALSLPGIHKTWEGKVLQRIKAIQDLKHSDQQLQSSKLNTHSDFLLAKSLSKRAELMNSLKKNFHSAQKSDDWSLELLYGHRLKEENLRLAIEIENLPTPKNLKKKDVVKFRNELKMQSKPFRLAHQELSSFLEQTWKNKVYLQSLLKMIDNNDLIRSSLMKELSAVASIAPKNILSEIQAQLEEFKNRPTTKDIAKAQMELQNDPFDTELQQLLLTMEKRRGNQSMVVFLQARGQNIKGDRL